MQLFLHPATPCFGGEKANVLKVLKVKDSPYRLLELKTKVKSLTSVSVPVYERGYQPDWSSQLDHLKLFVHVV